MQSPGSEVWEKAVVTVSGFLFVTDICVCVCVCVCVYVYVSMYACMYVFIENTYQVSFNNFQRV